MQYAKISGAPEDGDSGSDSDPMQETKNPIPPPVIPGGESREPEAQISEDDNLRPGQWSPHALDPEEYVAQEVISEEADLKMTQLLRQQVRNFFKAYPKSENVFVRATAEKIDSFCLTAQFHKRIINPKSFAYQRILLTQSE